MHVQIGQLVVYESGAVKVRIGSVLYDLEPGISPNIREEVAGITSLGEEPACPLLGEVQQHAVITPDMDHLLRCTGSHPAARQAFRIHIIKACKPVTDNPSLRSQITRKEGTSSVRLSSVWRNDRATAAHKHLTSHSQTSRHLCCRVLQLIVYQTTIDADAIELPAFHCSGQPMPDLLPVAGLWTPPEKVEAPREPNDVAAPMDVDVSNSLICTSSGRAPDLDHMPAGDPLCMVCTRRTSCMAHRGLYLYDRVCCCGKRCRVHNVMQVKPEA